MRVIGWLLVLAGLGMAGVSLGMDVSVEAAGMVFDDPALQGGRVANWDMIGQRTLLGILGGSAFISGWLVLILQELRRRP